MMPAIRRTMEMLTVLALLVSSSGCASMAGFTIGAAQETRYHGAVDTELRGVEELRSGEQVTLSIDGSDALVTLYYSHLDWRENELVGTSEGEKTRVGIDSIRSLRAMRETQVVEGENLKWEGLAAGMLVDAVLVVAFLNSFDDFDLGSR